MNISQLSYSKHCILVHNNRKYFINYCSIKNCIKILLSNPEILQYFIFKYENKKKYAEASIPSSVYILSFILYSDATTTDTLGKSSLYLIYISLGNILIWRRNKKNTKQLLGYFLILFIKNEKEKKSPEFKKLVFQKDNLIDTNKDQMILRDHENMMKHFNNNTGHLASLEPVENYFWNILNLNIYVATVSNRIYHLDLGLYHYQIEFIKGILGRLSIDKINKRIKVIPSLLSNNLSEVYVKWNKMYILSRLEIFKKK
ncbi:hypothetical protein Glove_122g79 [Diversispora epigaea]|uniref:Uncharacterized protein n=1 Tax=Diversispora epigaea TaxID=1348612 RepID=A0A397IYW2_9GLOM|nr:hypothetical protein Glove_122g79 [Diversispora epigaea]